MTPLHDEFINATHQAGINVLIMFGMVALSVAAWYAIDLLPAAWRSRARFISQAYAIGLLTLTLFYRS